MKVIKSTTLLPVLGVFLFSNVLKSGCFSEDETCLIRFYEGQYFMGNFWSLDAEGSWTSSRKSYFRRPYRNFGIKSIRMYGPDHCRWQICPLRTRRNFHQPRWKKCRLVEASKDRNLDSLRKWGWKYYIIGNVIRLPHKASKRLEANEDNESLEAPNRFLGVEEAEESSRSFDSKNNCWVIF